MGVLLAYIKADWYCLTHPFSGYCAIDIRDGNTDRTKFVGVCSGRLFRGTLKIVKTFYGAFPEGDGLFVQR
jgi:hypothetical protein